MADVGVLEFDWSTAERLVIGLVSEKVWGADVNRGARHQLCCVTHYFVLRDVTLPV